MIKIPQQQIKEIFLEIFLIAFLHFTSQINTIYGVLSENSFGLDHNYRKSMNICLLDDDTTLGTYLGKRLQHIGYRSSYFNSIQSLKKSLIKDLNFDLYIIDVFLEQESSFAFIEELLKEHTGAKIILSSGTKKQDEIKKFRDLGINDFLLKPYKSSDLEKKIKEILVRS